MEYSGFFYGFRDAVSGEFYGVVVDLFGAGVEVGVSAFLGGGGADEATAFFGSHDAR